MSVWRIAGLWIAVGLAVLTVGYFLSVRPARAHEFYDAACCNERDCRPALPGEIAAGPAGWSVAPLGFRGAARIVPYGQERTSPDGRFHLCARTDGSLIDASLRPCIYVPPQGF